MFKIAPLSFVKAIAIKENAFKMVGHIENALNFLLTNIEVFFVFVLFFFLTLTNTKRKRF